MSALERILFGWQCLLESVRACRSAAVWGPWLVLFSLHALAVAALAWAAHPAISWFMAPGLRAVEGDAALRYPGLFLRLPLLARDAGLVIGALALPVLAGVWTRLFERRFRQAPAAPGGAWAEGFSRSGALVVAALPVTVAAFGLHEMLHNLHLVRLSSVARSLAPPAADAALLFVRITCAYAAALVVLGRRSGPGALAAIPGTWSTGFVPAAVALLSLSPFGVLATAFVSASEGLVHHGVPEWAVAGILARAAIGALLAMIATGAVTLAWQGGATERGAPA